MGEPDHDVHQPGRCCSRKVRRTVSSCAARDLNHLYSRPILFRSSLATARAFNSKNVPHPHGNAISADAFARGVIRSGTDYSVYAQGIPGEKNGMGGVDLAFYKNRAFYHTRFDSIPGMGRDEGRKALWAMMETTQGVGVV